MKPEKTRRLTVYLVIGALVVLAACAPATSTPGTPTPAPSPTAQPTDAPPRPASTVETEPPVPKPTATPGSETWSSTSPDGEWTAQGLFEGPFFSGDAATYHTQLKVASADGAVMWTAVDEDRNWGLGYDTPRPFHWSRDGHYLYFTNVPVPDGCGLFVNGSDLRRLDLTDGSVAELVPGVGLSLALSPDEKTLAYIGYGAVGELTLRDVATGSERRAQLDVESGGAGNIVWSPDGSAVMLVTTSDICNPQTHSIVRVDAQALSVTMFVRDDDRRFTLVEWPEADRALLSDKDGNHWWMDATTGQLTPVR